MYGHQGAGGGTLFLGAHGIGVERRDCREYPTHARRGDEEGQPEQRRRVGEAHGGEADGGDQPADPDQSRRWPVQAAHQELGQDQRDAHCGQGDAGHPRGVGGIQAQPVEGEEAHGDLRHGDAEHRHEAHRQRPPQAAVADRQGGAAVRLATLLARQPAPERQQGDQGQRAGDQQRQDQPVSRQQSGQPRPDHHAYRAGRAESGQRRGASLRLDVIGHQCRRAGRHRGVETAGEAAQENDTGEGEQGRQRPVQGEHDEQAERAVGEGEAGQPAEQYPPSPMPVAGDAPGPRREHPGDAADGHRGAGLPGREAELAGERADQGDEGHHREGADEGLEHQRTQVQGVGGGRRGGHLRVPSGSRQAQPDPADQHQRSAQGEPGEQVVEAVAEQRREQPEEAEQGQ